MAFLSEADVERALLEQFASLGYTLAHGDDIGPEGKHTERKSYHDVILQQRFTDAVTKLNPTLPESARQEAINQVLQQELPSLLEENRRLHRLMTEGISVTCDDTDGSLTGRLITLLDFHNPENNDWLVVNQFTVIKGQKERRPDVVVFVNGLPLAVIELKAPGSAGAHLRGAYNQLQTYKDDIPALFRTNALLVTSDGISARAGSLSANLERFMPWRTTDGQTVAAKGTAELSTLIEGLFEHQRLLTLLRDFTVFGETGAGLVKILAGYHQFHAVLHAVTSTRRACSLMSGTAEHPAVYGLPDTSSQKPGDRRAGVIWHTQGSGKSLLMAFYAGMLVRDPFMNSPTLVVLTDRNDLDDQLFGTFSMCHDLIRQAPEHANSRDDLQRLLRRNAGGVIFTTLQKFGEATGILTDRSNVVVIADEAALSKCPQL